MTCTRGVLVERRLLLIRLQDTLRPDPEEALPPPQPHFTLVRTYDLDLTDHAAGLRSTEMVWPTLEMTEFVNSYLDRHWLPQWLFRDDQSDDDESDFFTSDDESDSTSDDGEDFFTDPITDRERMRSWARGNKSVWYVTFPSFLIPLAPARPLRAIETHPKLPLTRHTGSSKACSRTPATF